MHESLRLILVEGLEERIARHALHGRALVAGLESMGLAPRVAAEERLAPLTAVAVPQGIDDGRARSFLLNQFGLEIGGGLGPMAGNTWRIGLMGAGATRHSVTLCLAALRAALTDQGQDPGVDPLMAAGEIYSS